MGQGLWGIDIKARKATLYSGGNTKANTSTLQGVGEAVAELLSLAEEELVAYKNKAFTLAHSTSPNGRCWRACRE